MAARSKACGRCCSFAGIAGSNSSGGMDVSCESCVLSGRGLCVGPILVQRSHTECGVSVCDREASIIYLVFINLILH